MDLKVVGETESRIERLAKITGRTPKEVVEGALSRECGHRGLRNLTISLSAMEFNDENTWPADVLDYLRKHHSLFLTWAKRGEGPKPCPVAPEQYDSALEGLRRVLNNHALHGYHCTRLTDDEIAHIESNGMQLPDGAMLKRRVEALERAGRIEAQVGRAFVAENCTDGTTAIPSGAEFWKRSACRASSKPTSRSQA
jgi:hypothetical protein